MQRRSGIFFKKKITNDSLLTAIDSGSIDNVLSGGNLINDPEVTSEGDKEVIRRINNKAAQIMEYAIGESEKLGTCQQ